MGMELFEEFSKLGPVLVHFLFTVHQCLYCVIAYIPVPASASLDTFCLSCRLTNHFVGNSPPERISATASVLPVSHLPGTSGALLAASRSPETFSQATTAEDEDEDTYYSSDDDVMSFSSATQPSIKEPSRQEVPY
jgi:hypothetical protein